MKKDLRRIIVMSGPTNPEDELWNKIPPREDIYFIHDGDIEIDVYTGVKFDDELMYFEHEKEIPLKGIIRKFGEMKTEKSMKYLCELLLDEWEWQHNVYGYAKIAGGYHWSGELSGFIMVEVYLWCLKALEKFHNESVAEPVGSLLLSIIRKNHSPFRGISIGGPISTESKKLEEFVRSCVGILSNYNSSDILKEAVEYLDKDGRLSESERIALIEMICEVSNINFDSKLIQEEMERETQKEKKKRELEEKKQEYEKKTKKLYKRGVGISILLLVLGYFISWELLGFGPSVNVQISVTIEFILGFIFACFAAIRWQQDARIRLEERGCCCVTPLSILILVIGYLVAFWIGGSGWYDQFVAIAASIIFFILGFASGDYVVLKVQWWKRYRKVFKKKK